VKARGDESYLTETSSNISFYNQMTRLVDEGKLWILSTWTLVRPLTLFSTAFSWKKQLPMVWMDALSAGYKPG